MAESHFRLVIFQKSAQRIPSWLWQTRRSTFATRKSNGCPTFRGRGPNCPLVCRKSCPTAHGLDGGPTTSPNKPQHELRGANAASRGAIAFFWLYLLPQYITEITLRQLWLFSTFFDRSKKNACFFFNNNLNFLCLTEWMWIDANKNKNDWSLNKTNRFYKQRDTTNRYANFKLTNNILCRSQFILNKKT